MKSIFAVAAVIASSTVEAIGEHHAPSNHYTEADAISQEYWNLYAGNQGG